MNRKLQNFPHRLLSPSPLPLKTTDSACFDSDGWPEKFQNPDASIFLVCWALELPIPNRIKEDIRCPMANTGESKISLLLHYRGIGTSIYYYQAMYK
ncbi:hypothetical protein U9M48_003773 [Paspalum notatum var. saurae]|uniref:Uncharacterized protein n=1 Tax=Paspalum notatum var. saurae TaxID=547442 RepID=A0AAQ3SKW5_PASNO